MASTGNNGNGNTGTTGQSAASAQAAAAAGNAAASNAANGNTGTGNTSNGESSGKGNGSSNSSTSTNTSTSNNATNSAGLMGSLIGFGNAVAKGEVGNGRGGGSGGAANNNTDTPSEGLFMSLVQQFINAENARKGLPSEVADEGDKAYTKARAEGKTEADAQKYARKAVTNTLKDGGYYDSVNLLNGFAFRGKNTGPTYNPANTAMATTNPNIAKGSSEMGPSAANNAPGNIGGETGGGIAGGTESAAPSVSDAANTGVTNRGGTVANGGGTSVTDSGTGGSISSNITPPSRDASSIGLGVYDNDRANYDQDNWNRGMESESSSLVSDEECKAFAKRAFMENSEPFKKCRVTIIKKC